jgi:UDP-N-acetylglucosamine/UDP-N-acetylgalactosamine diphosphorylase
VLILAGGQGSRLGFNHPKGMFCINDLPSRKSIFQILTERFIRVQELANGERRKLTCKMLVMTSRENHDETCEFFKENGYFGVSESDFIFFPQAMLPALDLNGKILMNSPSTIKLAPNGNGALFDSIKTRGDLRKFIGTLEYLQVIGVDNAINKILDPIQIGYTKVNNLEASLKCCPKRSPEEKVGVVATKDDKYAIVEYSDLSGNHMNARKEDGSLQFE